jgi:hypothetical protein
MAMATTAAVRQGGPRRIDFARVERALRLAGTRLDLAKLAGVGESTLYRVRILLRDAPASLLDDVRQGTMAIKHAHKMLTLKSSKIRTRETAAESASRVMVLIEQVADGQFRTHADFEQVVGTSRSRRFLDKVALIPWLTITRSPTGVTLTINHELRTICEWQQAQPQASGSTQPVAAFLHHLRTEIVRRRHAARDGYRAWRADNINTLQQSKLLDWIEEELDKLPKANHGAREAPALMQEESSACITR